MDSVSSYSMLLWMLTSCCRISLSLSCLTLFLFHVFLVLRSLEASRKKTAMIIASLVWAPCPTDAVSPNNYTTPTIPSVTMCTWTNPHQSPFFPSITTTTTTIAKHHHHRPSKIAALPPFSWIAAFAVSPPKSATPKIWASLPL